MSNDKWEGWRNEEIEIKQNGNNSIIIEAE